jgi:tRNA methyl transferase
MALPRCLVAQASSSVHKLCHALSSQPLKLIARSLACRHASSLEVLGRLYRAPEYTLTDTDRTHPEVCGPLHDARWLAGCVQRCIAQSDCQTIQCVTFIVSCRCSPERAPLRVAVLLSGGVDSSLALALLKAAGHEVHAFYLQIWFQEDFRNFWDSCPWEEDLDYAQKVCCSLMLLTQLL